MHYYLHELGQSKRWSLIVVSLDTAVSLEFGDLLLGSSSGATVDKLYEASIVATLKQDLPRLQPTMPAGTGRAPFDQRQPLLDWKVCP